MVKQTKTSRVLRACMWTLACVVGAYAVGRGAVELVTIHYNDPASYRLDWGGPSLAGVLAVHAGGGLAALIAAAVVSLRRLRRSARAGRTPSGTRRWFGRARP